MANAKVSTYAIDLLIEDHEKVKKLFKQYEKLKKAESSEEEKAELAANICLELTVHAQIEEEIFYPAVRDAIEEEDLMDEAEVEHSTAKDLISQIQEMDPVDELYDAKVKVLGEYINHHVEEEQNEMFPKVKKGRLELQELGEQLLTRKEELMTELGNDEDEDEGDEPKAAPRRKTAR